MKGSLCRLAETSFLWRDTAMRIRERFNPRAPCGARPCTSRRSSARRSGFQPTRPLRGATAASLLCLEGKYISTHAPLAGRDAHRASESEKPYISTHAPLAGRDERPVVLAVARAFQPTRPLRGATAIVFRSDRLRHYFNPRAPCGARRASSCTCCRSRISTHAPLAGRDCNRFQV